MSTVRVNPPMVPPHVEGVALNRAQSPGSSATEPEPSFREVFQRIAASVDQGEKVVSAALHVPAGADDDRKMLALQAGVYRYVEAVDLCSRIVDRTTNGIKTVLQSQ